MLKPKQTLLIAACLCCATLSGCAITEAENRKTLNSLDQAVQESGIIRTTTGKVAAAPIALPVGVAAGVIDMAVVTPARATVPAAKDTNALLWDKPEGSDLRKMMLVMPKMAATPVVFLTDWAFRSVFTTKF